MNGIELIAAERTRQIEIEGFDEDHDGEHKYQQLAMAALCYLGASLDEPGYKASDRPGYTVVPSMWPWLAQDWKPSYDAIRNLVKAGALIAAEIDRLQYHKAARSKVRNLVHDTDRGVTVLRGES